jgi:hypothetical protein
MRNAFANIGLTLAIKEAYRPPVNVSPRWPAPNVHQREAASTHRGRLGQRHRVPAALQKSVKDRWIDCLSRQRRAMRELNATAPPAASMASATPNTMNLDI